MQNKIKYFYRDFNQWSLLVITLGLLIAIPLLVVIIYLFDGVGEMWSHIVTYFLADYILNSLLLLVGTGVLCSFFGTFSAWVVSNYEFPLRKLIQWLLFLPLAIPSYIVAYSYVGLLGNDGSLIRLFNNLGISIQKIEMMNIFGLIWVLAFSLFPYVYAASRSVFISFPKSIDEASNLLGASHKRYVFKIALPMASPAIIGGLFLVFMEVLNDYGAAKYYGINTFTTGIFRSWTMLGDLQSAIYLSALLVILVFMINGVVYWLRRKKSYAIKLDQSHQKNKERKQLTGKKRIVYLSILAIPILFGFILPVTQLLYWGVLTFHTMVNFELLKITFQSFSVAIIAASFTLLSALLLIYFSKWNVLKQFNSIKKIAVIGYVIPGAIIGIGIIKGSQTVINFFNDHFNLKIGYLFYGSSIILIYAYVFRFLAVAYNPLYANTEKIGSNLSESSYVLGIGKLKTLFKIEFPLLKNVLLSTSLLVIIDVLKELPLTLILKPYKLQTLAIKAFEYADDERVAEAAIPALVLILIIVLLMMAFTFVQNNQTSKSYN